MNNRTLRLIFGRAQFLLVIGRYGEVEHNIISVVLDNRKQNV